MTFLVLARVFTKGLFDFGMNQLCKISALHSFLIGLGLTCAPTIFDWSTVLIKATAVTCVVTLEWAPMLLAEDTVLVGPAHFLGLLGNWSQWTPSCASLQPLLACLGWKAFD